MKLVVPMNSTHCFKPKYDSKSKRQKHLAAGEIANRYMELIRLRGQVDQLEQKSVLHGQPPVNRR